MRRIREEMLPMDGLYMHILENNVVYKELLASS